MNHQNKSRWALARLALGLIQMFGAVFSVTLIVQDGLTSLALLTAMVTGVLTLISVVLFGGVISGILPKRSRYTGRKA